MLNLNQTLNRWSGNQLSHPFGWRDTLASYRRQFEAESERNHWSNEEKTPALIVVLREKTLA